MKSASKMGSSTNFEQPDRRWLGIPNRRTFPLPPGLGMMRSRTGSGRNEPVFSWARRSIRKPGTPTASSMAATVTPSTPGVFAPTGSADTLIAVML